MSRTPPEERPLKVPITTGQRHRPAADPSKEWQAEVSLASLARDHTLFSLGVINICGYWDRDPAAEFVRQFGEPGCEFVDLSWVAIPGLSRLFHDHPVDWSRRLHILPTARWPLFRDWLCGMHIIDEGERRATRFGCGEMSLLDERERQRVATLTVDDVSVTLHVFAVDASDGGWRLISPRQVAQIPPSPEIMRVAQWRFK